MRGLSIRARITVGATVIAALLLLAGGIIIYAQVERIVRSGEDAVLAGIEAPYVTAISQESGEELDPPGDGRLVLVSDAEGATRLDTMPTALSAELQRAGAGGERTRAVTVDATTYLVRTQQIAAPDGEWTVSTARDFQSASQILDGVALLLIVSLSVIAAGFGAAAWVTASAALRPVTRLQQSAEQLAASAEGGALPTGPVHDEIDALARTLNDLLRRTRESADRERQVVSDASHELRTPLAILSAQLEVAASPAVSDAQRVQDLEAARTTLRRLIRISQGLLDLSRLEAQGSQGVAAVDELARELADAVDRARIGEQGAAADIDFRLGEFDPSATVTLSASDFGRVLDNLISNAVSAAAAGSAARVMVSLSATADELQLLVSDESGGVDADFADRVFERFSRGPDVEYAGGGLGLPIVAKVVANAGGQVALDNRPGEGLTVAVTLPIARPAPRPTPG